MKAIKLLYEHDKARKAKEMTEECLDFCHRGIPLASIRDSHNKGTPDPVLEMRKNPDPAIYTCRQLDAQEAISFARWILDKFEETP